MAFWYLWKNDLLIYSQMEEEYLKHTQLVFEKSHEAGIKFKMSNCEFFNTEIEYLGYVVSGKGIPLWHKK